jgi:hypothetical protein
MAKTHASKCGAQTRNGGTCQQPPVPGKERCRFHGGKSTGPKTPEGKAAVAGNALKHGIFTRAILEVEEQVYLAAKRIRDLRDDLAMARLRLLRAETVHKTLQEKVYAGDKVDQDALDRSFIRCDRLARTVGRLQEQQARVLEVRELEEKLGELTGRVDGAGPP